MEFLKPTWEEIERDCKLICGKIIADDFIPDVIVGIIRGGMIPARMFSDFLNVKNVATIRIEFYTGIGQTKDEPRITQEIKTNVKGKKVLLVDDVADSGKSLKVARNYMFEKEVGEIKTATIHYKPESILKPDYFAGKTEKWIIYPWEKKETQVEIEGNKNEEKNDEYF